MRKLPAIIILCILVVLCGFMEASAQSVITSSSVTQIPAGRPSVANITYVFASGVVAPLILSSTSGVFSVGATTVASNPIPLSLTLPTGSGSATEVLQIPVRVVDAALARGSNTFTYTRGFTLPSGATVTATFTFTITTAAGASFSITRISLYFDNRRGEITIARNESRLRAFADISFQGTGLLQGYWEADGRILSQVTRYLTYGSVVTLETPRTPPLPTFDTGTHILRFVITSPVPDIGLPQAIYYVTPTDAPPKPVAILPAAPSQGGILSAPFELTWSEINRKAVYLIEFYEDPSMTPLFSAYTKTASYKLPATVLANTFTPGKTYFWKVTGYDAENRIIGESAIREFLFP